jgi:putative transport protein
MEFIQALLQNQLSLLFIILTLGCLLGKLSISGLELSSSGGVLFVALAFGHFHYGLSEAIGTFGFAFFIYAIGFGAGPRFFQTFRKNGFKFILTAVFVATVATGIAVFCGYIFDLPKLLLPGILAGALTSTSTMAAAYEIVKDPIISVSYGITYPFGLIGLLLLIQFLPKFIHVNLKKEAEEAQEMDIEEDENHNIQRRVYCVKNPKIVGVPLKELNFRELTSSGLLTVKHGDQIEIANAETTLEINDHVLAEGYLPNLIGLENHVGPEVMDNDISDARYETAKVVINRKCIVHRSLSELRLAHDLGVIASRIQRGGIDLSVNPNMALERGDVITLVGKEDNLKHAVAILGRQEHKIYETDIFTFSAGLVLGVILGMIKWPIINASIGNAGGLLFMGILLGYLRNFGPFSGRVPIAARYIFQELGLLLFLASIGTSAGIGLIEHLKSAGLEIFFTGALITTFTLISTVYFCHYILKFDWNTSFGATTGGVTSTVALKIVTREAASQYPVLGYAGVYAFANILLTMLGQIILLF